MGTIGRRGCGWRHTTTPMLLSFSGEVNTSGVLVGKDQVKTLLATLGAEGWSRLSAGDGAKGPRWYDWRWLPRGSRLQPHWRPGLFGCRSLHDPGKPHSVRGVCPWKATGLETVVQVAGSRWTVERCFEEAKGDVGLDQYEVRSWTGWYRHITSVMGAYVLLTANRAAHLPTAAPLKKGLQGATRSSLNSLCFLKSREGWGAAECARDSAPFLGSRARHTAAR